MNKVRFRTRLILKEYIKFVSFALKIYSEKKGIEDFEKTIKFFNGLNNKLINDCKKHNKNQKRYTALKVLYLAWHKKMIDSNTLLTNPEKAVKDCLLNLERKYKIEKTKTY